MSSITPSFECTIVQHWFPRFILFLHLNPYIMIILHYICMITVFFQYSFHWRLLESVVPFVELNCQFLLLNDMFDMRAINYLLTYLQCWCRNFQVARLSTIPLANGETCSAEVTGLFPGGDIDSKHWYQLSVL